MKLQEIKVSGVRQQLLEARRQKMDANQKIIKAIGQQISILRKGNRQLNSKMGMLAELMKIMIAASLDAELISKSMAIKGVSK